MFQAFHSQRFFFTLPHATLSFIYEETEVQGGEATRPALTASVTWPTPQERQSLKPLLFQLPNLGNCEIFTSEANFSAFDAGFYLTGRI